MVVDCVLARGQREAVGRCSPWWWTVFLLVDSGQLWVGVHLGGVLCSRILFLAGGQSY